MIRTGGLHTRRRVLAACTTALLAAGLGQALPTIHAQEPKTPPKENPVTTATATARSSGRTAEKDTIRPFRVNVPQADLDDLRQRIKANRWPDKETDSDASQG